MWTLPTPWACPYRSHGMGKALPDGLGLSTYAVPPTCLLSHEEGRSGGESPGPWPDSSILQLLVLAIVSPPPSPHPTVGFCSLLSCHHFLRARGKLLFRSMGAGVFLIRAPPDCLTYRIFRNGFHRTPGPLGTPLHKGSCGHTSGMH